MSLNMRTKYTSRFIIYPGILVLGILLCTTRAFAQGDLLISPLRIVFEGAKKSQEINLANVGKDTANYVISVIDIRMKEDGSFEEITEPDSGQNFAGKYLRFFPRRVSLAPNEAQVVKVQLIKTNELAAGEYRSHLYFRSVPDEKPLGETMTKKDSTSLSVHLVPIFGISTPVIIRIGENTAQVRISDMALQKGAGTAASRLSFKFNRTGNMSVYGDLKVEYISPGGKSTQLKLVKGVGVYTPNEARRINIDLDADKNIDFSKGKLHVVYTLQTNDKSVKTADAELVLQ